MSNYSHRIGGTITRSPVVLIIVSAYWPRRASSKLALWQGAMDGLTVAHRFRVHGVDRPNRGGVQRCATTPAAGPGEHPRGALVALRRAIASAITCCLTTGGQFFVTKDTQCR